MQGDSQVDVDSVIYCGQMTNSGCCAALFIGETGVLKCAARCGPVQPGVAHWGPVQPGAARSGTLGPGAAQSGTPQHTKIINRQGQFCYTIILFVYKDPFATVFLTFNET